MIGPVGVGNANFVPINEVLPYTIEFENEPTATAPAQQVVITEQLDPNLDLGSFRLGSFGFGGMTFQVPANSAYYQTTIDLTQQFGYVVDVTATIDERTGIATWIFTTIDPATGAIPLDPTIGFLPPDTANGVGEGFVSYTIMANQADPTGTVINAQATVTFDTEPPLNTPQIFNTIDAGSDLMSAVAALPTYENSTQFDVSWSGLDAVNGSAISSYTVFVSDNDGPFTAWLTNTTLIAAPFVGRDGHTYAFYSVATDNAGNVQPIPTAAQASTIVDATPPTSTVAALPAFSPGSFTLNWVGSNAEGLGIASYDIFVSDNGSAFVPLLSGTTLTSTSYTGVNGHTYAFYSVAIDTIGKPQPTPTAGQTSTTVDTVAPTSQVNPLPHEATFSQLPRHGDRHRSGAGIWRDPVQDRVLRPLCLGQRRSICLLDHRPGLQCDGDVPRPEQPYLRLLQHRHRCRGERREQVAAGRGQHLRPRPDPTRNPAHVGGRYDSDFRRLLVRHRHR